MVSVTTVPKKNADHHGSHQGLLKSPPVGASLASRGVDAIFVPTFRTPGYLAEAVKLARALDCALVTLHSGPNTTALRAAGRLQAAGVNLIAIDIPAPSRLNLPDWETSQLLHGTVFARRTDLSAKRNLALVLSRLLGWTRLLSLDDDITGLHPEDVCKASGLLDEHNAVGLRIYGFPDHSVVCHAYLQAGGDQKSFIGGGAMVLEAERSRSFFPDIYNDDWFFLLNDDGRLQPTAATGSVIQHPYDPFKPERARAEELGDVLAEGIYWLLDQGQKIADANGAYWSDFLEKRRHFIERVLEMVKSDDTIEATDKERRIVALRRGSLSRLALITPELCAEYLRAWTADRKKWLEHIDQLPTHQDLAHALSLLSRRGSAPLKWHLGGKIARSVRNGVKVHLGSASQAPHLTQPSPAVSPPQPACPSPADPALTASAATDSLDDVLVGATSAPASAEAEPALD
jgi:hypothetical protein